MANNMHMQEIRGEMDKYQRNLEKERNKQEMERAKKQFDDKITELADLAVEYSQNEDQQPLAQLLMTFLDISLKMQDVMKTVQAVSVAMNCITEAISFLDTVNQMDNDMLDGTLQTKYGALSRFKQRMKHRKAMRNHRNRMKQFISGMDAKFNMAQDMIKSMDKFSQDIQKSFNKRNKKKGADGGSSAPVMSSRAKEFLASRAKEKGVDINISDAKTDTSSSASGDNMDDIFPGM